MSTEFIHPMSDGPEDFESGSSFFNTADGTLDPAHGVSQRLREIGEHRLATRLEDCGRRHVRRREGDPIVPRWCRLKICPICATRSAKAATVKYLPPLSKVIHEGGHAYFVTLTAPAVDRVLDEATRLHRFARSFTTEAWWRELHREVSVLTALEFGPEQGHPHIHHLVVCRTPEGAGRAVEALVSRWLRRHPQALLEAQDMTGPLETVEAMRRYLGYITKGSRLQTHWDDAALLAALRCMTNRKRPLTACGAVLPPRRPRK